MTGEYSEMVKPSLWILSVLGYITRQHFKAITHLLIQVVCRQISSLPALHLPSHLSLQRIQICCWEQPLVWWSLQGAEDFHGSCFLQHTQHRVLSGHAHAQCSPVGQRVSTAQQLTQPLRSTAAQNNCVAQIKDSQ